MTVAGWLQAVVLLVLLTALTPWLGAYMSRVFAGEPVLLSRLARPVEARLYRFLRADPAEAQDWKEYARTMLVFSALCFVALYLTLRTQRVHPLNPQDLSSGTWDVSFNTAVSFVSNTSWQFYGGETALSTFAQMAGIAAHSFLSAAVGLAVGIAVIRGFASRSAGAVGVFWVDLTRSLLYVIVPIAVIGALVLVSQGVVQSLAPPEAIVTLVGGEQRLVVGPVASQAAIKTLGSVGGGYFNVNSAMPLENATGLSSLVQILLILVVPAGLTATFGRMVGSRRQGWVIFAAMAVLLIASTMALSVAEGGSTAAARAAGVGAPNMEGKEVRFGAAGTALYAAGTTTGASGAVNGAHEALTGAGGAVTMANMMTGEMIFGGIGSGIASMLMVVLLTVFLAGLMVGRTPEYLGKQVGAREVVLVMIGTIGVPVLVLVLTAVAVATPYGTASIVGAGPQGFSETLYAYTSQAFNNGSAFAGYTGYVQPDGTNQGAFGITFADLLGGLAMLAGRYLPLVTALAVAGGLAGRRVAPSGPGTLRSDRATFVVLLLGVVVLVALLTFIPALLLGPIAQTLTDRLF